MSRSRDWAEREIEREEQAERDRQALAAREETRLAVAFFDELIPRLMANPDKGEAIDFMAYLHDRLPTLLTPTGAEAFKISYYSLAYRAMFPSAEEATA